MKDICDRMKNGGLYCCNDPALQKEQLACLDKLSEYNQTRPSDTEKRFRILQELFAEIGEGCYVEIPLRANWGRHTHFGKNVYANFNLTLVDDTDIFIGDSVLFGPNVTLVTAGHPVEPELRRRVFQYNVPVHIGKNVWIGAGVIVLPGVTIGENSVIGAGAVVTKDVPADVVAFGNPCRVVRPIGERDREFYFRDWKIK